MLSREGRQSDKNRSNCRLAANTVSIVRQPWIERQNNLPVIISDRLRSFHFDRGGVGSWLHAHLASRQASFSPSPIATRLRQHLFHHFALHVRQAHVASAREVGQQGVIQAQQMQNRRVQVMNVPFAVLVGGRAVG